MNIVDSARRFAVTAHSSTNHTYDGKPYVIHLMMVVENAARFQELLEYHERELALAGSWVHDTIEDTRNTYNDVAKATSAEVAEVAYALTNEKGRNRAERANAKYYEGIRDNKIAWYVKICDRLANVEYSKRTNSKMLKVYQSEDKHFRQQLFLDQFAPMFDCMTTLFE